MTLHPQVLAASQRRALHQMGAILTPRHFYLAGGTALALRLGHRRSVDLDWFTAEQIADAMRLAQEIRDLGAPFETSQVARGTLHGRVSGVRVSLLEYRYPLLAPLVIWPAAACALASLDDLACMKLSAIAQRGSRKDFVDLYALGREHRPLEEMLRLYQRKYSVADLLHLVHALAYFDDADRERMPRMLWNVTWRAVKKTIQEWLRGVAA
jgi:predicted nucleotidyltransferase component of viral defense system